MMRALISAMFGFLLVLLVFIFSLIPSAYILFWGSWFGWDCANADSISDKMSCGGTLLIMNGLIAFGVVLAFLTLRSQLRLRRQGLG
jgi:hypothetical protein